MSFSLAAINANLKLGDTHPDSTTIPCSTITSNAMPSSVSVYPPPLPQGNVSAQPCYAVSASIPVPKGCNNNEEKKPSALTQSLKNLPTVNEEQAILKIGSQTCISTRSGKLVYDVDRLEPHIIASSTVNCTFMNKNSIINISIMDYGGNLVSCGIPYAIVKCHDKYFNILIVNVGSTPLKGNITLSYIIN